MFRPSSGDSQVTPHLFRPCIWFSFHTRPLNFLFPPQNLTYSIHTFYFWTCNKQRKLTRRRHPVRAPKLKITHVLLQRSLLKVENKGSCVKMRICGTRIWGLEAQVGTFPRYYCTITEKHTADPHVEEVADKELKLCFGGERQTNQSQIFKKFEVYSVDCFTLTLMWLFGHITAF